MKELQGIKKFYFASVIFGLGNNLIAETENGDWYQQKHVTLENQGGGASEWFKLKTDKDGNPLPHDLDIKS